LGEGVNVALQKKMLVFEWEGERWGEGQFLGCFLGRFGVCVVG